MEGRFPHQGLLGGVGIVVVLYLVFNVPGHVPDPFTFSLQSSSPIQGLSNPTFFFYCQCTSLLSRCQSLCEHPSQKSLDPDRHFVVIHAEMMRYFVQYRMLHLFANAVGVAVTVAFDGALENGDGLRVRAMAATIGGCVEAPI